MARCEDCIHEKVCLHRANIQTDTYAYMGVKYDTEKCEIFKPTADVVPKSEVERLEAELAEWHNLTQKSVSGYIRYCEREAVKNFTEEFEEDCLDFPMKETDIHLIVDKEKYEELKKKYTGSEADG